MAIDLSVTEDIVVAQEGTIEAHTTGAGRGGDIVIQAERVSLTGGAFIDTSAGVPPVWAGGDRTAPRHTPSPPSPPQNNAE